MTQNHESAITRLIYSYAERLDLGDFEGVAALFAHATYRSSAGGHYVGSAAVLEVLNRLVERYDGIPRTKHVITNVVVERDDQGQTAHARSYFTVVQATEGLPLQVVICGRYHDAFTCADGVWRFSDRMILVDLVGDLSKHVRRTL